MIDNLLEKLYLKVFVSIVVNKYDVTVQVDFVSRKKGVTASYEERFKCSYINDEMVAFIESHIAQSPYYYISVLDMSPKQGVIPTCSKTKLSYYHDVTESEYRCHNERWTYYTSQADLYEIEKIYKPIGVDFIFSPFVVLSQFFADKIESHLAMFALVEENFISLAIFDNGKLLFGQYLDMENAADNDEFLLDGVDSDEELDLDEGINLEDVDVIDDVDEMDDFGDIEDLDALEDIDEFAEAEDVEEELHQESEEEIEQNASEESFNEDYQRFSLIQSAINHFYKDPKYDSTFVEHIYIADDVGISPDLKRYLEEEMFLTVYVRKVDITTELSQLAQEEVGV